MIVVVVVVVVVVDAAMLEAAPKQRPDDAVSGRWFLVGCVLLVPKLRFRSVPFHHDSNPFPGKGRTRQGPSCFGFARLGPS